MKLFLVISVLSIVLFVVVCPFAPTPTVVVSGKTQVFHVHTVALALIFFVPAFLLWQISFSHIPDCPERLFSAEVLDLTCVRLC
jgi:hypothetical protein